MKKNPWEGRLRRMKEHQEAHSQTWARNESMLFGESLGQTYGAWKFGQPLAIGFAWGLVTTLETQIYEQDPDCLTDARDPRFRDAAKNLTAICRYDFSQMDVKSSGNLGLIDCMTSGYYVSIETVETEKGALRYPVDDKDVPEEIVTDQNYATNRIVPKDFLIDPQALRLDLSDARYIAVAFYPTISGLRDDPSFTVPVDIEKYRSCSVQTRSRDISSAGEPVVKYGVGQGTGSTVEEDPDYKTICVWEIWDQTKREIIYMTDDKHTEIGRRPFPFRLQLGNRKLFPVTVMGLWPVTTGWYCKPIMDCIYQQLTVLNELDQRAYTDFCIKIEKYGLDGRVFNAEQAAKLTDPAQPRAFLLAEADSIGDAMGQNTGQFDMNRAFVKFEDVTPPKDFFAGVAHVKNEMQEILGWGPMDRGGLPSVRSAREAVLIAGQQEGRIGKLADRVCDYYRLVGAKHIQILQQTMAVARYARLLPIEGMSQWLSYSKDDIAGDFEFIVYSGSSMPKKSEAKKAQVLQFFQALAPIMLQAGRDITPLLFYVAPYMDWDGMDEVMKNPKQVGKDLAVTLAAVAQGQVPPQKLLEAASQAVRALLTDADLQQLAAQMQSKPGGTPAGAQGAMQGRGDPSPTATSAGNL